MAPWCSRGVRPRKRLLKPDGPGADGAPLGDRQNRQREALSPGSFGAQVYEASRRRRDQPGRGAALGALVSPPPRYHDGIGMALYNLARHPRQWAILAADPSLSRAAFDEALRFDSSAPYVFRSYPARNRDRRRADRTSRKILLLLASASRDEARWEGDRTEFGITRPGLQVIWRSGPAFTAVSGQMVARLGAEAVLSALASAWLPSIRRRCRLSRQQRPERSVRFRFASYQNRDGHLERGKARAPCYDSLGGCWRDVDGEAIARCHGKQSVKKPGASVPVHMPIALRKRHFTGAILPFLTVL